VAALIEAAQRGVDARDGFGLHLNHGQVDVAARVGLRDVLFVGGPLAPALVAHGPNHALHLGVELPLALLEQPPDVLCAS
jgi:hypothetical protein